MDELIQVEEAAQMMSVAPGTLRYWRHIGYGPQSAKMGRRIVYKKAAVLAWIEEQFATPAGSASAS